MVPRINTQPQASRFIQAAEPRNKTQRAAEARSLPPSPIAVYRSAFPEDFRTRNRLPQRTQHTVATQPLRSRIKRVAKAMTRQAPEPLDRREPTSASPPRESLRGLWFPP